MRTGLWITALVLCSGLLAGERGEKRMEKALERGNEFSFIEEHAKELNLTDAQKKELKALSEKTKNSREKLMKSPEARAILEEMREARKNGSEEQMKEMRQKLMATVEKDPEFSPASNLRAIGAILTPDQRAKLRELREKEGKPTLADMREMRRDGAGDRDKKTASANNKPDPSRGVPSLYENEK